MSVGGQAKGDGEIRARLDSPTGSEAAEMGVSVYQPLLNVRVIVRHVLLRPHDDVQVIAPSEKGTLASDVCVSAGPDGILDTEPQGDDVVDGTSKTIQVGANLTCDTLAANLTENPSGPAFSAGSLENFLNTLVYNQCVASFSVQTWPPVVVDYDIVNPDKDALDRGPEEWPIIRDNASTGEEAYHVFIVDDVEGFLGLAPKNYRWVFVEKSAGFHTIAHELGHAFGNLDDLVAIGHEYADPENLMSYANYPGFSHEKLRKQQWDTVHVARDLMLYGLE